MAGHIRQPLKVMTLILWFCQMRRFIFYRANSAHPSSRPIHTCTHKPDKTTERSVSFYRASHANLFRVRYYYRISLCLSVRAPVRCVPILIQSG